ncbi:MAG TPA: MraY family glycosyltransferase [Planctomycetota bacterium]|nr:MraY family glycosyltransferase [Planctomycetota bacterium]
MNAVMTMVAEGLLMAFLVALVTVPLCIVVARRCNIVDHPGGRKTHGKVTPLLGGVGVFLAVAISLLAVELMTRGSTQIDLRLQEVGPVLGAAAVIFVIGLIDDVFKDRMAFQLKLAGQILGVVILDWPQLSRLVQEGGAPKDWLYQLFFLCWFLTIVNSFNFSDNMNGLMSGLSIVAFLASLVYLGSGNSLRTLLIAVLLTGALLGFMPWNFPRSRVFLGDAGSMFVGFWMGWVQFDMVRGFPDDAVWDHGISKLVPAVLIMGVPLYDAAFVVLMRAVEKRPIYLGDNHHLSHRLVRAGFTPAEAVVILWGLAIVLAGVGILAAFSPPGYRYLLLGASFAVMVCVTRVIMSYEHAARTRAATE